MKSCLPVKISKHASVLSNDPLMPSNSTRFKKRSPIPLKIRIYNKNTPTPQLYVLTQFKSNIKIPHLEKYTRWGIESLSWHVEYINFPEKTGRSENVECTALHLFVKGRHRIC